MANAAQDQMAGAYASFGLSPTATALLRGVLAAHTGIRRAIIYGSRAKGNFRPGSDIDLTLDAPELVFDEFLRIEQELDDLMLPYRIDLSLLSHIDNPALREHIARVGRPLWQAPQLTH